MTTTTSSTGNVDGGFKPSGEFMQIPYFDCNTDTFHKCFLGKRKGGHWNTFMGKTLFTNNIKEWLKKNKNKSFMLRDEKNNTLIFAHKGVS